MLLYPHDFVFYGFHKLPLRRLSVYVSQKRPHIRVQRFAVSLAKTRPCLTTKASTLADALFKSQQMILLS